ncbi:MAG: hypothetical protein KAI79_17075, partial [Bacteroidales bacterium]|nr:hypothetical protein [Bacteroidales bacterium]
VILDECQDTVAVSLEIFKLLKADTKIGLGDRYQAIYDFMKLVSAFKLLTEATVFSLTKSFRCSTLIAERVDLYGKRELSEDFTFKGTTTPEEDGKTAYITATNASIIKRIKLLHEEDKGYVLTKNLKDIFACPLALATASSGKPVMHRQYKFLDREYKNYTMSKYKSFFKYLKKEVYDEEVHGAIELLTQLKQQNINIFTVLKDAKNAKRDSNLLVATYFSAKGLGFETVHIEKDLNYAMDKALKAKQDETMTESHFTTLKGYYVACTRARVHLHNATHL